MRETRERPVCHRAEDLVSYLYGEATTGDAVDYRNHLQECDACRREFAVFNQVHDSMQLWRNEALGAAFDPLAIGEPAIEATQLVPQEHKERRLSALAALREFFTVAPLWLRGATAFAGLLLCVLGVVLFARVSRKPVDVAINNGEKTYSRMEVEAQVKKAVDQTRAELAAQQNSTPPVVSTQRDQRKPTKPQVAVNQPKAPHPRGLNRQERAQLAADLRLTLPADENESLLAMPEQDNPIR